MHSTGFPAASGFLEPNSFNWTSCDKLLTITTRLNGTYCPNIQLNDSNDNPTECIRLDHFLQMCGVQTGGQAKRLIQDGQVMVNGEIELRRRKKLQAGDLVSVDNEEFEVMLADDQDNESDGLE